MTAKRLGIIGFGYIAQHIYRLADKSADLDLVFVWNRTAQRLNEVPRELVLNDLSDFASRRPELVVEMAHPAVSAQHGAAILAVCDYMLLSVTALADPGLYARLIGASQDHGTRLFVPRGALVGLENLRDGRDKWIDVSICFRKHPDSLDLSATDLAGDAITAETVVFDGTVRDAAAKFPRNVNTMATCALAGLGFDKTRAVVIADPALSTMIAQVKATAKDGSLLETTVAEPAVGVSGTGMLASQWNSIRRATLGGEPGLNFV